MPSSFRARGLLVLLLCAAAAAAGCSVPLPDGTASDTGVTGSSVTIVEAFPPGTIDADSIRQPYVSVGSGSPAANPELALIFEGSYGMNYQSIGMRATVEREPFVIEYAVVPKTENPHYAFLICTVRDDGTGTAVIEEGFNRIYSSERTKQIIIRKPGVYHLTWHGAMLDLTVRLYAGR